ncbi:hypothetical protein ACWDZ4_13380 [Streptomyces sp. NPDC003016]
MTFVRAGVALTAVLLAPAPDDSGPPLPDRPADTGGGSQPISAVTPRTGATTGTLPRWDRRGGKWVAADSANARFGTKELLEGGRHRRGTGTTPPGTGSARPPPRPRDQGRAERDLGAVPPDAPELLAVQDNRSRTYSRWVEPLPTGCRAAESEHPADYGTPYAHALVIGFTYGNPVRGGGPGTFLRVRGQDVQVLSVTNHLDTLLTQPYVRIDDEIGGTREDGTAILSPVSG